MYGPYLKDILTDEGISTNKQSMSKWSQNYNRIQ